MMSSFTDVFSNAFLLEVSVNFSLNKKALKEVLKTLVTEILMYKLCKFLKKIVLDITLSA